MHMTPGVEMRVRQTRAGRLSIGLSVLLLAFGVVRMSTGDGTVPIGFAIAIIVLLVITIRTFQSGVVRSGDRLGIRRTLGRTTWLPAHSDPRIELDSSARRGKRVVVVDAAGDRHPTDLLVTSTEDLVALGWVTGGSDAQPRGSSAS